MDMTQRLLALTVVTALGFVPNAAGQPEDRPYPSARHGGNYMRNYYLPPAPSSTPWAQAAPCLPRPMKLCSSG